MSIRDAASISLETLETRSLLAAIAPGAPVPILAEPGLVLDSMVVADFDRDGVPDLAASRNKDILFFKGQADGGYETPVVSSLGYRAGSLASGRFNGDQIPDLAAVWPINNAGYATWSQALVRILYFDSATSRFSVGIETRIDSPDFHGFHPSPIVAAGNVLGGVRDELVIALNTGGTDIRILQLPDRSSIFEADRLVRPNLTLSSFVLADADGDSRPDVVYSATASDPFAGTSQGSVRAWASRPDTMRTTDTRLALFAHDGTGRSAATSIAAGDFTGDGLIDFAVAGTIVNTGEFKEFVSVVPSISSGRFASPNEAWSRAESEIPAGPGTFQDASLTSLLAADFDHDGRLDLSVREVTSYSYRTTQYAFRSLVLSQAAVGAFTPSALPGLAGDVFYDRFALVPAHDGNNPALLWATFGVLYQFPDVA